MKFELINLLAESNGRLSGPLSPVAFAQEMTDALGDRLHGLCRVRFDDECIHNSKNESTYYDTLVIYEHTGKIDKLTMWIDTGTSGIPVALMWNGDDELIVTPAYRNDDAINKLSDEHIKEIFKTIFNNIGLIKPERIVL